MLLKLISIVVIVCLSTVAYAESLTVNFKINHADTSIAHIIWQIKINNLWFQYIYVNNEYKIIGGNSLDEWVMINGDEVLIPNPDNSWSVPCGRMNTQSIVIETSGKNFDLYVNGRNEISRKFDGNDDTMCVILKRILMPFNMNSEIETVTYNGEVCTHTNLSNRWYYSPTYIDTSTTIQCAPFTGDAYIQLKK